MKHVSNLNLRFGKICSKNCKIHQNSQQLMRNYIWLISILFKIILNSILTNIHYKLLVLAMKCRDPLLNASLSMIWSCWFPTYCPMDSKVVETDRLGSILPKAISSIKEIFQVVISFWFPPKYISQRLSIFHWNRWNMNQC